VNQNDIKTVLKDKAKLKEYGFVAGTGLLVIVLYFFLLLKPQWNSFKKHRAEVLKLKQDVVDAGRLINNIEDIKSERDELSEKNSRIEKKIPEEKEVTVQREYISSVAGESNVEIISLVKPVNASEPDVVPQANEKKQVNPFSEALVLVRSKGSYHQLGMFVNRIENSEIMRVKEFKIESFSKDDYKCSFRCLVGMLVRKEQEEKKSGIK